MLSRWLKYILLALILIHIGGLTYFGNWAWKQVHQSRPIAEENRLFSVESGSTLNKVLEELANRKLAPSPILVRLVLSIRDKQILVKKGTYQLPDHASTWDILELFDEGAVLLHRLTIPEGLDKWETAKLLGETQWGDEATFLSLINNPAPIAHLDARATDLEGYLFPETYYFEASATPQEIITALTDAFLKETKALRSSPEAKGMALRDLLALASLVEEESAVASERATIAGVFAKRLQRGMLLQCDPTIIYSLKLENIYRGKIYRSDIHREHPYNTYTTAGLPPGPICSPGLAAIEAALNPADTPYLYFVARNDGTHHFSRDLREHNRAVRKYQR